MQNESQQFTVTVRPSLPPPNPILFSPDGAALADQLVGTDIGNVAVTTVSGGVAPYSITIGSGKVPDGENLGQTLNDDGSVSLDLAGTPTTAGDYAFTIKIVDAGGATATLAARARVA